MCGASKVKGMFKIPFTRFYISTVTSTTLLYNFGGIWSSLSGIIFLLFRVYLLGQLYRLVAFKIYKDEKGVEPEPGTDLSPYNHLIQHKLSFNEMYKLHGRVATNHDQQSREI